MDVKEKALHVRSIQTAPEIFVIMSACTRMPYVYCDPKSYDDQVLLFHKEEDAKKLVEEYKKNETPIMILKLENKQFLPFFANLYMIGVNGIAANIGTDKEWSLQLSDIVRRQEEETAENKKVVENPEFHLTALYLMQEARKRKEVTRSEEFKELEEEMMAHFKKGNFIIGIQEEKTVPILKLQNGDAYQPIFTDISEYMKFAKGKQLKPVVLSFDKLGAALVKEAKGIIVNPMGVNILLNKGQL